MTKAITWDEDPLPDGRMCGARQRADLAIRRFSVQPLVWHRAEKPRHLT